MRSVYSNVLHSHQFNIVEHLWDVAEQEVLIINVQQTNRHQQQLVQTMPQKTKQKQKKQNQGSPEGKRASVKVPVSN